MPVPHAQNKFYCNKCSAIIAPTIVFFDTGLGKPGYYHTVEGVQHTVRILPTGKKKSDG